MGSPYVYAFYHRTRSCLQKGARGQALSLQAATNAPLSAQGDDRSGDKSALHGGVFAPLRFMRAALLRCQDANTLRGHV